MRKVFELMRLQAEGLSVRQMSASLQLARSTVSDYLRRIERAALSWPLPEDLDESEVLERLFGPEAGRRAGRPAPDWSRIHTERQRPGVTLQLLWLEYKAAHPRDISTAGFASCTAAGAPVSSP